MRFSGTRSNAMQHGAPRGASGFRRIVARAVVMLGGLSCPWGLGVRLHVGVGKSSGLIRK